MKEFLLICLVFTMQFNIAQEQKQSDLKKIISKAQEIISNVDLKDLKKNKDYFILLTSDPMSNPSAAIMSINTASEALNQGP